MRSSLVRGGAPCVVLSLLLILGGASTVNAQDATGETLQELRAELERLREQNDQRVAELEARIEALEIELLRANAESAAASSAGPASQASSAQTSYNALNPAITAIGNFLGRVDNQPVVNEDGDRLDDGMNLREVELDLRLPVDPYADGVVILALESETPGSFEAGVEEAYVNIKRLPFVESPLGLRFQVGRFRPAFGKFNLLHTHDLPQSMRSLTAGEFLGEEGFIQQGVSLDFFVPLPVDDNSSLNARVQVLGGGEVALAPERNQRLAYLGNLRWFRTFGDSHSTDLGWSSYIRPGTASVPVARMHALDFLYRWRPPRQGEWKSFLVGGEWMLADHQRLDAAEPVEVADSVDPSLVPLTSDRPNGYSVFTQWQFDRRKYAGVRWDDTSTLVDPTLRRQSLTPYFSYYFSEFLRLRFNYERRWSDIGAEDGRNSFLMELTSVFGAHPPEPFWVNR
jgi:hypothetical protein